MHQVYNTNITGQDISSYLLVSSYTSDTTRSILVRCTVNNIMGGDDYTIYASLKEFGTTSEVIIQPINSYYIDSGIDGITFPSMLVPLNTGDIVNIYIQGLSNDRSVSINTTWFDLSIASASAVANIPTNPLLTNDLRIPDMIASASSLASITGTSASTIWTYVTRELTTATPSTSASEIWNYFQRTLTSASGLGLASGSSVEGITGTSASTIWEYTNRTLTSASGLGLASGSAIDGITGTSASTIWEYGERTLTSASSILDVVVEGTFTFGQIVQIMASVLAGKMNGSGTGTLSFRDLSDTLTRISVEVNGLAERTGVTINV